MTIRGPYKWTPALVAELMRDYPQGGAGVFAARHGLTSRAVRAKAARLGIRYLHHKPSQYGVAYSAREDDIIRAIFPVAGAAGCAEMLPARSAASVYQRARALGVSAR